MITITVSNAIERLKAVECHFTVTDIGIVIDTLNGSGQFERRKFIPFMDSLGSLVSRDAVNAEAVYWQNRRVR